MNIKKEFPENGIVTLEQIQMDRDSFALYQINLDDGDNVVICGYHATGILKIRDTLSPENKQKMNDRTVLELLFLYEQAVKDGVISEPHLRTVEHVKKEEEVLIHGYTTLDLFPYVYDKKGGPEKLERLIFKAAKDDPESELAQFLMDCAYELDEEIKQGDRI